MVGALLLLGGHLTIHQSFVLIPGGAYRIHVKDLHRVMNERTKTQTMFFPVRSSAGIALRSYRTVRLSARSREAARALALFGE